MKPFNLGELSHLPLTTYRLGFHRGFRLGAATRLLPYFQRLGMTTLYASPLFAARTGSGHGYDLIDPSRLNPEVGTSMELERLSRELRRRNMGMILDIVPNHMAAHYENPWWRDLLENGEASAFSMFFDVDWAPPQQALAHRISLPVLGDSFRRVLENQELELVFTGTGFAVRYWETLFPVDPATLPPVLSKIREILRASSHPESSDTLASLDLLLSRTSALPARCDLPLAKRQRSRSRRAIQGLLKSLHRDSPAFREALEKVLTEYRGIRGIPSSFDRMEALLSFQVYWISHWKTVTRTLNYRRFFDVADLVGVRMEDDRVFEAFHRLVREWVKKGWIDGVRVDHIDGLRDPATYLFRLSRLLRDEHPESVPLVWVEKILGRDETLPDWPVMGTTGYEFASRVLDLFTDPEGVRQMKDWYETRLSPGQTFEEVAYQQKKFVAETLMGGELRRLTLLLEWIAMEDRDVRETGFRELQTGLVEVTACMDVYRTYIREDSVPDDARLRIGRALDLARKRHPNRRQGLFRFFERVLTQGPPPGTSPEKKARWSDFVLKWQQFSGAVMAKGVEDTALYLYTPLLSANEVGNDPGLAPAEPAEFHRFNLERLENFPFSLSTTSTHDTKRSADVRARIAALSLFAGEWIHAMERWRQWNRSARQSSRGGPEIPDPALEHFLYQTLIGAWPLESPDESFVWRIEGYLVKALRESKQHTNWITPDPAYEEKVLRFVREILRPDRTSPFLKDFVVFQRKIALQGARISLSQLLLKATAPGVFDLYRGEELWDLSLVDPDNRRPVDYTHRVRLLNEVIDQWSREPEKAFQSFLGSWEDGRIKLFLTWVLSNFRKDHPLLFLEGRYRPLPPRWEEQQRAVGFFRSLPDRDLLVVALTTTVSGPANDSMILEPSPSGEIPLPEGHSDPWFHLFSGVPVMPVSNGSESVLPLDQVLQKAPFAVLYRGPVPSIRRGDSPSPPKKRGAP
ncbi:MAG: malto-oligosyltrehalose synthase [Leptospirillia bacterium]